MKQNLKLKIMEIKEQINKLETEIETIITNNAKQIIEGGYSTIAD